MRRILVAAAALLGVLALSGCGFGPPTVADRVVQGLPDGWDGPQPDVLSSESAVGWVDGDDSFGVVLFSSGSCPPVADSVEADDTASVTVAFRASPNDPCTADSVMMTHVFDLPPEVVDRPVTVTIAFPEGSTDLALP